LAQRYNLYSGALFQTQVLGARWEEDRLRWIVSTDRGDKIATRFLVSCTGILSKPKLPRIAGIESFTGHAFHTSRWDYGYTAGDESGNLTGLEDKTVGIIGTGATALQCVPHLGAWAKRLYIFQRTPSSVDERGNRPTDSEWAKTLRPGWQRERMENFAALTTGGQQPVDLVNDGWTDIMRTVSGGGVVTDPHEIQRAEMTKMEMTRRRVDRIVKDPYTASALKPYYHYFCKRPGFHDEYLETFNRPNVTLVDTKGRGVERITAHGAVVEGKEYPLDLLIFATGFDYLRDYAKESGVDPVGQGELRLSEHWNEGARTLYGMQTHGFPNFFLLSVIQAGGSINYVHVADEQACHIAHIIDRCRMRGIGAIQPTREAEDNWVEEVLSLATARRAFFEACTPGYYNFEGKRGRAQQLNDFYYGKPMAYLNLLKEFRADDELHGLEPIRERSDTPGKP
jgi:cyclohexanone monooxygenase